MAVTSRRDEYNSAPLDSCVVPHIRCLTQRMRTIFLENRDQYEHVVIIRKVSLRHHNLYTETYVEPPASECGE